MVIKKKVTFCLTIVVVDHSINGTNSGLHDTVTVMITESVTITQIQTTTESFTVYHTVTPSPSPTQSSNAAGSTSCSSSDTDNTPIYVAAIVIVGLLITIIVVVVGVLLCYCQKSKYFNRSIVPLNVKYRNTNGIDNGKVLTIEVDNDLYGTEMLPKSK